MKSPDIIKFKFISANINGSGNPVISGAKNIPISKNYLYSSLPTPPVYYQLPSFFPNNHPTIKHPQDM